MKDFCALFWRCGLVVLSLGCFWNYLKISSCTRYWKCGRRILNILFVMCFYQFSALIRANSCRVSQWTADTVDQILTEEMPCMWKPSLLTIVPFPPDTETLSLTHLPDRVRWSTVTVDPAKLNQLTTARLAKRAKLKIAKWLLAKEFQ